MAIEGIGVDLVSVKRLGEMVEKWEEEFLYRVFTEKEREYCLSRKRRYEHLAGRFAAKEAVVKAIGRKLPWREIEIITEKNGKPHVRLDFKNRGIPDGNEIHVSITHTEEYAIAMAIMESGV